MENFELTKKPDMNIFDRRFPSRLESDPIYDPTKMTILTGSDGILDDLFSYQVYNKIKNHWRAAVAPADIQAGMIWSDSDDDKLYHHGAADEEILQLTRSADVSPYFANLYLAEYIYHTGDLDTNIRFQTDQITLRAGGVDFIKMVEAATDYLKLLTGKNFIGDTLNTFMTIGLTINQGANDDEILAFKSEGDVAHGITDEAETETYGLYKKWDANAGGLKIMGLSESFYGVTLIGFVTSDTTTKSTAGRAPMEIYVGKKSGTGIGDVGADANLFAIRCKKGGGSSTEWILDEDGDTWQEGNITLAGAASTITGGTVLHLLAGSRLESVTTFNNTTATAANCVIGAGGVGFARETSAKKYKNKIKDMELDSSLIYSLQCRSFNSLSKIDDKNKRFIGLIADEIERIYPEIIHYGENNGVESYDRTMLMTLILAEVQRHEVRIKDLESQLNN